MYLSEIYGKGGIYAKVVTASIANDIPIYTIEIKAPKFIDAEFEKHRMLSSNSSSSRAIPFKPLDEIYVPFDIRKSQKGMQGYEPYTTNPDIIKEMEEYIKGMYMDVIDDVYGLESFIFGYDGEVHKQHLNRYIEPWMFQKKVITGTEWGNFFKLRLAEDPQPEIQELARCMKEAMEQVNPSLLLPDEWHLPYVTEVYNMSGLGGSLILEDAIKCSVARCARVSYMNHDNTKPNIEKDLELYAFLVSSGHFTPLEHQASPMKFAMAPTAIIPEWEDGVTHIDRKGRLWSGNFRGFLQYRQLIQDWN